MVISSIRACLILCLLASASDAQPPTPKETPKGKEGDTMPALPTAAADATPLRKAQVELVREGVTYIARCKELMRTGAWAVSDFRRYSDVLTETCRVAAELEEKPANRVPWHELRVRRMKDAENLLSQGVKVGSVAPQELNLIRFQRLQAEIDLIKIKAEIEKPSK